MVPILIYPEFGKYDCGSRDPRSCPNNVNNIQYVIVMSTDVEQINISKIKK
jgi:hypothetical protein